MGKRVAIPLLAVVAVVVAIESADLVFAAESVPAVLAVSNDAFIVYSLERIRDPRSAGRCTSCSPGLLERFHPLSKGLTIILAFIGVKLTMQPAHKVISTSMPETPLLFSLAVIVTVLTASTLLSLRRAPVHPDGPAGQSTTRSGEERNLVTSPTEGSA